MALSTLCSEEASAAAVAGFYAAALHRTPDEGAAYWVGRLTSQHELLGQVLADILGGPGGLEFYSNGTATVAAP